MAPVRLVCSRIAVTNEEYPRQSCAQLGFGVRDAWAQDGVKQKEIDSAFAEVSSWISLRSLQILYGEGWAIFWLSGIRLA